MNTDLQKASMWKRISAWLFDSILLACVAVLFGSLLSYALDFDGHYQRLDQAYAQYEKQYGIEFNITEEAYTAMDEQEKAEYQARYDEAYAALIADEDAMYTYGMVVNLTLLIMSIGILLAFVIMELLIPLWLKNGQTLGKKIFSIGVMRTDSIKLTTVQLFVRTILGKYAVETMVPVYVLILLFLGTAGIFGIALVAGVFIAQVICLIAGGEGRSIHDRLSGTVVVDITSQKIFRSSDELIAYTQKVHAEQVRNQSY